jgi:hypothetical protein
MSSQTVASEAVRSRRRRMLMLALLALVVLVFAVGWFADSLLERRQTLLRRLEIEKMGGAESRVKVEPGDLPWWSWLTDKRFFDKVIAINLTDVRDYDFRKLASFGDLESLTLWNAKVSDDDVALIATLPRLRSLNLHYTNLMGPELKHLADLPNLEELRLGPIHEDLVPNLAGCNSLRVLRISSFAPQFTDRGLRLLPELPSLKTLYLYRTGTTEAGEKELKKRFPELEIIRQTGDG